MTIWIHDNLVAFFYLEQELMKSYVRKRLGDWRYLATSEEKAPHYDALTFVIANKNVGNMLTLPVGSVSIGTNLSLWNKAFEIERRNCITVDLPVTGTRGIFQ